MLFFLSLDYVAKPIPSREFFFLFSKASDQMQDNRAHSQAYSSFYFEYNSRFFSHDIERKWLKILNSE